MIDWTLDTLRLAWGLLYWNTRKSYFRLRRGKSPCPCQSPSDSGRAMETACDAVLHWHNPARFRHVCPLLQRTPSGLLRCSVATADVRPFWLRALVFYAAAALALYLGAALAFFATQRALGKPFTLRQVVWPPAWREHSQVQSLYFAQKAERALTAKDFPGAMAALSLAYTLNPQNYSAGLTLAQLCQVPQPGLADRVFSQLLTDHPAQRATTLTAWYQSLLIRGDFGAIIPLCADALKIDPAHLDSWLHALVFALKTGADPAVAHPALSDPEIPAAARALLELNRLSYQIPPADARRFIQRGDARITCGYLDFYRPNRLIELGYYRDALQLLDHPDSRLGGRDRFALWMDANATFGWNAVSRGEVKRILRSSLDAGLAGIVSAHLIRHPDREVFDALLDRVREAPLKPVPENYSAFLALFCAAGALGDTDAMNAAAALVKQVSGSRMQALDAAMAFFASQGTKGRIESILPLLQPQPIEVNYALLAKYHRPRTAVRPAAPAPAP